MNAIEILGLSKSFGRIPVLRDLNLTVQAGQIVTVLGPNGSGKTTLIRILAGLTSADAGVVRVFGADLSRRGRMIRGRVGVVTHQPLMYDELTAYENLYFHAKLFGLDKVEDRILNTIELMDMMTSLNNKVGTLSHGIRKRLSIARALLHDPLLLLMDEPESGLDQQALSLLDCIISDRSAPTRTILMTTHNLDHVTGRVVVIGRGRIGYENVVEATGDISKLRQAYIELSGGMDE